MEPPQTNSEMIINNESNRLEFTGKIKRQLVNK